MPERYLMALDAGTGAGRCFLIDTEGKKAFSAYREWGMLEDPAAAPFGRAFDPQHYWQCLAESAREAMAKAGIRPDQVIAVSSTSQREGAVFLDKDGHEVYAGPNQDARALGEGFMLMNQFGQRAYEISGHYLNFLFVPARLLWHQNHVPEVYERIAHILMINDWILHRLCGEYACEPTNAAETAVYNLRTGDWDWSLIADIGLPKAVFPPILPSGHVLGRVSARAARETGLEEGTPVVIGAADTQCGILGAGAIADGDIAAVAGTTTPVQMVLNEVIIDPQTRLWSGAFIPPQAWVLESNAGATGIIYRWMRDTFCHAECIEAQQTEQDPFVIMSAEAAQSPIGSSGIQAFLGTNIFDAKNVMGVSSALVMNVHTLLGDPRARHHLLRAQLEGMAYAVRANAAQIDELAHRRPTRMYVCGGSSQSSLWVDILASVMNLPVVVPVYAEGTALGAAICAGVGAGAYGDFRQGMEALVKPDRVAEPDVGVVDQYNTLFDKWMQVRSVLGQIPVGF
jgi:autoinducer 2 (AI-2) kinase